MTKTDFIKEKLDLLKIAISAFIVAILGLGVYWLQISKPTLIDVCAGIIVLALCLAILGRYYLILSKGLESQE